MKIAKVLYCKFSHDPNNQHQTGKHPRGAVALQLDFSGKSLWFVNAHLEPRNPMAMRQVWQLLGKITASPATSGRSVAA